MGKTAWLGMGLMGAGMVQAALGRGVEAVVWNRSPGKVDAVVALGARSAATPAEAVQGASRVHLVLTDDGAVDAVLAQIVDHLAPDAVVIDHSTTSPQGTAARADRMLAAGKPFLHAPVFMTPKNCRDAKGLMLCSGPRPSFERVADDLAAMTGDLWYLGERPDLAAGYKLMGNALILTIVAGLADVFGLARGLDLEPGDVVRLFERFQPGAGIPFRAPKMAAAEFSPSFSLETARKDVRLMLEAAGGQPLSLLPALAEAMDRLLRQGLADRDVSVLAAAAVTPQPVGRSSTDDNVH